MSNSRSNFFHPNKKMEVQIKATLSFVEDNYEEEYEN